MYHIDRECEGAVELEEKDRYFKAESQEAAMCCVTVLRHRVCLWREMMGEQDEEQHSQLGWIKETEELSGPLFFALLKTAQELVGVLGFTC